MTKKHVLISLVVLTIVGFLFRFIQVGHLPIILNRDEAALAYNAYLLKDTGKDEWGRTWPLALQSFGDDKLIGYPFFLVLFFSVLGLSDLVVRLPSVIAGTCLIPLTYLFARRLLQLPKHVSLFAAVLIAIQPVFFFYSRIAFEANVALTLFVCGILCLFTLKRSLVIRTATSSLFFLAALFTYNTPLLLLPFVLPAIVLWQNWRQPKRWFPLVAGLLIVMAIGFSTLLSLSKQKSGITLFSDEALKLQADQYHNSFTGVTQKILGNKVAFFTPLIAERYVATFSPQFLVIRGGTHPWHQLPGFAHLNGVVYCLGLVGMLSTIVTILKEIKHKRLRSKPQVLLLFFLLIAPLPAAITIDAPHATRSLFFFYTWIFFSVIGTQCLAQWLRHMPQVKKVFFVFLFVLLAVESIRYYVTYFTQYPAESYLILRGGFDKTIQDVNPKTQIHNIAVIDDGGYQYILTAWYTRMNPTYFLQTVERHLPDKIGLSYGYIVGKYRFIKAPTDKNGQEKILVFWNENTQSWQVNE